MRVPGLSDAPVGGGGEVSTLLKNSQKVWGGSDSPLTAENCLDFGYCLCRCDAQNLPFTFLKKVEAQEPEELRGHGDAVASL